MSVSHPSGGRGRRSRLNLEGLEDRSVPAGNVTAFVSGGVLHVVGDEAGNQIYIGPSGRRGAFLASFDGVTTVNGQLGPVPVGNVRNGVVVALGEGDNVLGMAGVKTRNLQLVAGGGNDAVVLFDVTAKRSTLVSTGSGDDDFVAIGSRFRRQVALDAGAGDDRVSIGSTRLGPSSTLAGGSGQDTLGTADLNLPRTKPTITGFETVLPTLLPPRTGGGNVPLPPQGPPSSPLPTVAAPDSATVRQGGTVRIPVAANDSGGRGGLDLTSVVVTRPPAHGSLSVFADGSVSYIHDGSQTTSDSFRYTIRDAAGAVSNEATVSVTVTPANRPPEAGGDDFTTAEDTPLTIAAPGVLANDADVDGDVLTTPAFTQPGNGTVTVNTDGSFTYTPDADFFGADSFTYTVSDGRGGTATGTVAVAVTPSDDPPTAVDDAFSTAEGAPVSGNVLANDFDVDNDPPGNAGLTVTAGTVATAHGGSAAVAADGAFAYTPAAGFSGTDAFPYTVTDPTGRTATGTVTVTVAAVNQPPVANPDTTTVAEGGMVVVNVAANDTDREADLDLASVVITQAPTHGTATANPDGTVTYTNDGSEATADSFRYTVRDTQGAVSNEVTVTVAISPVNDPPVNEVPGPQSVTQDTPLVFSTGTGNAVAVADPDVGSGQLLVTLTATQGTLTLGVTAGLAFVAGNGTSTVAFQGPLADVNNALNGLTYTPEAGYTGPATVTATTSDMGHTGSGGPRADTDVIAVTVAPRTDRRRPTRTPTSPTRTSRSPSRPPASWATTPTRTGTRWPRPSIPDRPTARWSSTPPGASPTPRARTTADPTRSPTSSPTAAVGPPPVR